MIADAILFLLLLALLLSITGNVARCADQLTRLADEAEHQREEAE